MTQNGCVLLGVDCPESLRMAQALANMLPGADAYYAQQRPEQQHLTLGRFGGSDSAGFAAWLSESLAGQISMLPQFTGVQVQLSDEARPFPNLPVALTGTGGGGLGNGLGSGGLSLGNGSGLGGGFGSVGGGFDAPIGAPSRSGPIGGGVAPIGGSLAPIGAGPISSAPIGAPIGSSLVSTPVPVPAPAVSVAKETPVAVNSAPSNPPTYASAMASGLAAAKAAGSYAAAGAAAAKPSAPSPAAAAASASPEALLSMLQSSTAGAEGVGVLGTSTSASTGYVLRPQESAAWSSRLAPLVTNLSGVLATVGPTKFAQMIDGVANPNDWSLASIVAPDVARGARFEVVQDVEIAAAIEASAIATNNTGAQVRLTAAAVDQNVVGAPGHNNTGSPFMVCRAERSVDAGTGMTRVAAFALHLEGVSQLAPAEKPYLSLVFAWLGVRAPAASTTSAVGSAGDAPAVGSTSSAPPPPAPVSGGGGGVRRPGDWTCPGCHAHNFASRSVCFKCKNAKAGGSGGGGGSVHGADSFGGGKAPEPAGGPSAGNFRPGDWICTGCRAHNFASRSACFKCKQRKAGGAAEAAGGGGGSGGSGGAAPENFRSGDWMCNNCRAHNFASRAACFKCSSKPS